MFSLFAAVLLSATPIYTWVDDEGVEHFTDDFRLVPKGARIRVTAGDDLSVVPGPSGAPVSGGPAPTPAAPLPTTVKAGEPLAPSPSELSWRKLFHDARAKISSLQDDVDADRKLVEENGLPVSAGYVCQTALAPPPLIVSNQGALTLTAGGQLPGFGAVTLSGSAFAVPRQTVVAPCGYGFNPEYLRVKDRLEKNRRELVRANEELADLERRASFEAVPLHWRR